MSILQNANNDFARIHFISLFASLFFWLFRAAPDIEGENVRRKFEEESEMNAYIDIHAQFHQTSTCATRFDARKKNRKQKRNAIKRISMRACCCVGIKLRYYEILSRTKQRKRLQEITNVTCSHLSATPVQLIWRLKIHMYKYIKVDGYLPRGASRSHSPSYLMRKFGGTGRARRYINHVACRP